MLWCACFRRRYAEATNLMVRGQHRPYGTNSPQTHKAWEGTQQVRQPSSSNMTALVEKSTHAETLTLLCRASSQVQPVSQPTCSMRIAKHVRRYGRTCMTLQLPVSSNRVQRRTSAQLHMLAKCGSLCREQTYLCFHSQLHMTNLQALDVGSRKHPRQITAYIKQQRETALRLLKTPMRTDAALKNFGASIAALLSEAGSPMNSINFAAVMDASAQVWAAAQHSHSMRGLPGLQKRPEAVYQQCLQRLQPLMAEMSAWEICSVFWSSATLRLTPDAAVPGMVHDLILKFVQLTDTDKEEQRPNAQSCASLLEAVARMDSSAVQTYVLDAVCNRMCSLLQSPDQQIRPVAKDSAATLWALRKLKHAPSPEMVSAMLNHVAALCQTPGLQPTSADISSCLLACAELGLSASSSSTEALLKRLLELHVSQVDHQDYCLAVWSLAVMGQLNINILASVLRKLTARRGLLAHKPGAGSAQPTTASARQLYQALAWLEPSPGSEQMGAWSSLRSRLQAVAPQPSPVQTFIPGHAKLRAALAMQGLPVNAQMPYGMYFPDAVLFPHDGSVPAVFLMIDHSGDRLTNVPSR